jgi:hypothetical protein
MMLAIVIAGAVWSIVFGIQVYNKSNAFYDPLNPITISFVKPKSVWINFNNKWNWQQNDRYPNSTIQLQGQTE